MGFFNSGINTGPGVIMFAPNPFGTATTGQEGQLMSSWMLSMVVTAVVSSLLSFAVAYWMIVYRGKFGGVSTMGYRSIPGVTGSGVGSLREACRDGNMTTSPTSNHQNSHHHHSSLKNGGSASKQQKNHNNQFSSTEMTSMTANTVSKGEYLTLDI